MRLNISTRILQDIIIVDCYGRLIFGEEATRLREIVKEMLEQKPNVVLNLRDVNFIDSGGVGTLVGLLSSARASGGLIKLASISNRVRDVLQIARLNSVFEVYETEYAAVTSFRHGQANTA